jgi:hypothetical protein
MSDCVLDWMKKHLPPEQWTRKTYLTLAYLGNSPGEPLDPELEAEIPEEFQVPGNQSCWVGDFTDEDVIDINEWKSRKGEQS